MKTTNTVREYDTQAESFLAKHGLKFRATLSDSKTPAWSEGGKCGHHFRVTISKDKREMFTGEFQENDRFTPWACSPEFSKEKWEAYKANHPKKERGHFQNEKREVIREDSRLTFDFWGSIADAEKGIVTVKPYDVLACISTDAYTPATFADFCAEYGYEEDSIKALQMFRRCDRFAKRLRDFFTEQELADLSSIN